MNKKLLGLLLAMSTCIGGVSLAAYTLNEGANKEIHTIAKASGTNTYNLDVPTIGSSCSGKINFTITEGATFTLESVQNSGAYAPKAASENAYVNYYAQSQGDHFGCGTTIGVNEDYVINKIVLTATTTYYAKAIKYSVDGGDALSGPSWSGITLTVSNLEATSSFMFYNNASAMLRITNIEITYIEVAYNTVDIFVTNYMHKEIATSDKGSGLCKTDGWYTSAKAQVVTFSSEALDVFQHNPDFTDYYDRYLAWAAANGDSKPFEGDGIISRNATTIDNKDKGNMGLLITSIISFSLSISFVGLFLYDLKRR